MYEDRNLFHTDEKKQAASWRQILTNSGFIYVTRTSICIRNDNTNHISCNPHMYHSDLYMP